MGFLVLSTACLPAAAQGELTMARSSNTGKVGGAIAKRIREHGSAAVRGAGAVTLRQALKATVVAGGYLAERDDLGESRLAVLPRFEAPSVEEMGLPGECILTIFRLPFAN